MESRSKDTHGLRLISETLVIPGQAEDVSDAQSRSAQDVGLKGDPVSVPHHHLQHRVKPCGLQEAARGQAGHAHDGGLVVRDIDRIHRVPKVAPLS